MATLATILDVETEVELSLKTFLAATPYSLGAITTDTAAALTTPRVEVQTEVVRWGPHQHTPATGTYAGTAIYDQFALRVRLDLVYQPEQSQSPGTKRGTIRAALSNWTGLKAAFATRNYLMVVGDTLRQIDGSRTIDNAEKTETLSTVLELVVFLNPAAVAAAT